MALEPWVQENGHLKTLHNRCRYFRDSVTAVEVLLYLTSDVFSELRVASLILERLCLNELLGRMADTVTYSSPESISVREERGERALWMAVRTWRSCQVGSK